MNEKTLRVNGRLIVKGVAKAEAQARADLEIQDPSQEEIDELMNAVKEDGIEDDITKIDGTSRTDNNQNREDKK